jgi:hypothetical protein
MGGVFKEWSGILDRPCGGCGHMYKARVHYKSGEKPKVVPLVKTCANCGRYLKDAAKKRTWRNDPRYERGDSWS